MEMEVMTVQWRNQTGGKEGERVTIIICNNNIPIPKPVPSFSSWCAGAPTMNNLMWGVKTWTRTESQSQNVYNTIMLADFYLIFKYTDSYLEYNTILYNTGPRTLLRRKPNRVWFRDKKKCGITYSFGWYWWRVRVRIGCLNCYIK